ncbi:hypothetical protein D6C86_04664 [Aureobasidium pullulans]|uniref:Uncharacterized protein n=1 Tax=Aureobasidium pullulans TaxID=5580 RepID=A0A4V4KR12_AURPU|nr:hypothetical protein D6C94_07811 [Aureobasidium pullulans]THZ44071.1 hypothetical protein D6C87_03850 [Aureobasidium pullulans]THZ61103.1 hypothetical protein D6C86_04664 [Aureobasidium pullulans]
MPQPSGNEVVRLLPSRKTRRRRRDKIIAPYTINGTIPVRRKPTLSATMFRLPFKVPFSTSYPVYLLELIIGILWYSFRFRHRHYHPPTRERDIRVVWFYLRIISKNIQYRYQILLYRFRKMQYRFRILLRRFRILLHRFQILLDDMWTVMFLAMVVDLMTNIWDTWYIGRSHLLTQGISHAILSYRILAMLLLSELVQEALFSPHQAYWIIPSCYPLVIVYSIATGILVFLFHAFCFQGVSHLDHVMVYED